MGFLFSLCRSPDMRLACVRSDFPTPSTFTKSRESRMLYRVSYTFLENLPHQKIPIISLTIRRVALTVAEKLKREGRHEIFEQETMEELEDDEGNVYNRKTYEDLKKQGLI